MMDEKVIKRMDSNQLVGQYNEYYRLQESCWANATDGSGDSGHWFEEYGDAKCTFELLGHEIKRRKNLGLLYDGKRGIMARIYRWAQGRAKDAEHAYNITRKVMRDKYDIEMLDYCLTGVFAD